MYTVRPGDFPIKIAREFGISFDEFSDLNPGLCSGTQCRTLFPGDKVAVPGFDDGLTQHDCEEALEPPRSSPAWMALANSEIGVHESSSGNNARILQYLASVGLSGPDETSWCAAFVNWCLRNSGSPSANTGHAASWARWGRSVSPVYGAITVLKPLAAGASGHVGFLHAIVGDQIWLLSGNSDNQVRLSPYKGDKLIDSAPFRWPV
ncbi:MAG: peptidoglycan-binding lysin domain protein [Verrucomicrobiaceae bacterium]|nr:peptidoglycan-binding lysin domain protein [Verrucomicrobiaceae bacterium]